MPHITHEENASQRPLVTCPGIITNEINNNSGVLTANINDSYILLNYNFPNCVPGILYVLNALLRLPQ